jgi:hypothetical protein
MRRNFSAFLFYIATLLAANVLAAPAAHALLDDLGGYHIRFLEGRSCLANAYDKYEPLNARPCRSIGDDPNGQFDAFGPFYVLTYIRDHDDHKWLESRLTGDCISAIPSAFQRRPFADMCRPGSLDQKWEVLHESGIQYRVRHVRSGLCLGHVGQSHHVTMLPCDDGHTAVTITLQDPYPGTELPPYPTPHES